MSCSEEGSLTRHSDRHSGPSGAAPRKPGTWERLPKAGVESAAAVTAVSGQRCVHPGKQLQTVREPLAVSFFQKSWVS